MIIFKYILEKYFQNVQYNQVPILFSSIFKYFPAFPVPGVYALPIWSPVNQISRDVFTIHENVSLYNVKYQTEIEIPGNGPAKIHPIWIFLRKDVCV